MTRPWTLIDKFDEAARMAKAGCSVDQIISATDLTEYTAKSIKSRVSPDYSSQDAFDYLKKSRKDD